MHHGTNAVVPWVQAHRHTHTHIHAGTHRRIYGRLSFKSHWCGKKTSGRGESIRKGNKRRIHTGGAHQNNPTLYKVRTFTQIRDILDENIHQTFSSFRQALPPCWVFLWGSAERSSFIPHTCSSEPPGDNFTLNNGSKERKKNWTNGSRQTPGGAHSRGAINVMQTFLQSASWAAQIPICHIKRPDGVQNVWVFSDSEFTLLEPLWFLVHF